VTTPEPPILDRTGVIVNGNRFEEWTNYDVTSDIFTPSNTWSMSCGAVSTDILKGLLPGRRISIYFGDGSEDNEHVVLDGWIEDFDDVTSKSAWSTDIGGRDLASDLIETTVPMGLSVKNRTFYDVAKEVCDHVGLNVICTNEANRVAIADKKKYKALMAEYKQDVQVYNDKIVDLMKPQSIASPSGAMVEITLSEGAAKSILAAGQGIKSPLRPPWVPGLFKTMAEAEPSDGESCWDYLARYASRLEVMMWMSASGVLILQRPRYDQEPMYLFVNSITNPVQNNCVTRRYGLHIAGIPTSLTRIGHVKTDGVRERVEIAFDSTRIIPSNADSVIVGTSDEQDSDVLQVASSFYRPRWNKDSESRNLDELGRRAWNALKASEMGFVAIEIEVRGHDQGGILYTPDTVARLVDEKLGIDGLYYVSKCNYRMGPKAGAAEGKTTTLSLTPLYAWSPLA